MNFDPISAAPPAVLIHLVVAACALLLFPVHLALPKGSAGHVWRGRAWVALMAAAAVGSFWIRGPDGSLSWIHGLSVWVLVSLFVGIRAIRRGDHRAHRGWMTGAGIGLIVAFAFTFLPSRLVGQVFGI